MSRRVVFYCRVSTAEQARNGYGLEGQERALRERAEREGWTVVSVQRDEGVSGSTPWKDRPGLYKAVRMVQAKEADALVIARQDRLARRAQDSLNIAQDQLVQRKTDRPRLICLEPDLDLTTVFGLLIWTVVAGISESEVNQTSDRIRAALAAKKARGERVGRPTQYEPEVLRRIGTLRLSGLTQREIAETATAENLPTPLGGQWRQTGIHYLFKTQEMQRVMDELRADQQVIDEAIVNFKTTDKGLLDRLADS